MEWIIVLVLICIFVYFRYFHNLTSVKSAINGQIYRVMDMSDKQRASDMIAELDNFARTFIKNMRVRYSRNPNLDPLGYELIRNLEKRYKGGASLSENPPTNSDTSYTLNKGDYITLCLRQKEFPYQLHDIETMKYVFLHELAHVAMTMSDAEHSNNFWRQFKFILKEAQFQGLYTPVNYQKAPVVYCGLKIKYNPLFDLNAAIA